MKQQRSIRLVHGPALLATGLLGMFALMLLFPGSAFAQEVQGSNLNAFGDQAAKGVAYALGASFVAGIGASLTPCVWPMVPITVAIFGATEAKSRARGAALSATFVLGIACLFTPLGMAFAQSGKLLGSALASPYVVVGIAALFFTLAASMFGAFEMALPASLNNRLSTVGGIGFRGAFVLGLVMGLIAAPCTGPFLTGMVIWITTTKNMVLGGSSMFLFAVGLGMPFLIAGSFSVSLPKGGAWMLGIKWVSGVVLSYMALSYLRDGFPSMRNVIQPTMTFVIVAGVILVLGLVLGTIHIAAERRKSPIAHLSKPMKLASIVPSIVGMFLVISWINMPKSAHAAWQAKEAPALEQAAREKKPFIIDFWASWCAACKELDRDTWPDPRVSAETARFVTVKIDATNEDDPEIQRLSTKYKIAGLPTVVVLDSEGKERIRFAEFVSPEKMAEAIKSVK